MQPCHVARCQHQARYGVPVEEAAAGEVLALARVKDPDGGFLVQDAGDGDGVLAVGLVEVAAGAQSSDNRVVVLVLAFPGDDRVAGRHGACHPPDTAVGGLEPSLADGGDAHQRPCSRRGAQGVAGGPGHALGGPSGHLPAVAGGLHDARAFPVVHVVEDDAPSTADDLGLLPFQGERQRQPSWPLSEVDAVLDGGAEEPSVFDGRPEVFLDVGPCAVVPSEHGGHRVLGRLALGDQPSARTELAEQEYGPCERDEYGGHGTMYQAAFECRPWRGVQPCRIGLELADGVYGSRSFGFGLGGRGRGISRLSGLGVGVGLDGVLRLLGLGVVVGIVGRRVVGGRGRGFFRPFLGKSGRAERRIPVALAIRLHVRWIVGGRGGALGVLGCSLGVFMRLVGGEVEFVNHLVAVKVIGVRVRRDDR